MRGDRVETNLLDEETVNALNLQQEIQMQQRQQILQEQSKNQLLVDQQNRLIAEAQQAGFQRDNMVNVCAQAEKFMENQRLGMAQTEAQTVAGIHVLQSQLVASNQAKEVLENQKQQLQIKQSINIFL